MRRLLIAVYALVLIALAAGSATFCLQTHAEYLRQQEVARVTNERLVVAQSRLDDQQRMLVRLENDPGFVEMVIRRRLGYVKPNELIFRFEK